MAQKPKEPTKETKKEQPKAAEKPKETKKEDKSKPSAQEKAKPKAKEPATNKSKDSKSKKTKKNADDASEYAQTIQGSNCWAVHGNYTASGYPILAGDPHLNNGLPSIWVYSGIQIKDEYSFGSTVPGVPGTYFGRTKRHSWAITSMGADITDVFEERIEGNKYNYEGKWYPLTISEEVIKVKGKEPVKLKVKETRHGPIMTDVLGVM